MRVLEHHRHRRELFGDARDADVRQADEEAREAGSRSREEGEAEPVEDEEADRIFRDYWSTEKSQEKVAQEAERNPKTVKKIVNRAPRYREATREAARELGHPQEDA